MVRPAAKQAVTDRSRQTGLLAGARLSLVLDKRGRLLLAALAFSGLRAKTGVIVVEIENLRSWLDSWRGIGAVVVGMAHQGYDLQLTRYDEQGWRATFYMTGMEHSPTRVTG